MLSVWLLDAGDLTASGVLQSLNVDGVSEVSLGDCGIQRFSNTSPTTRLAESTNCCPGTPSRRQVRKPTLGRPPASRLSEQVLKVSDGVTSCPTSANVAGSSENRRSGQDGDNTRERA